MKETRIILLINQGVEILKIINEDKNMLAASRLLPF